MHDTDRKPTVEIDAQRYTGPRISAPPNLGSLAPYRMPALVIIAQKGKAWAFAHPYTTLISLSHTMLIIGTMMMMGVGGNITSQAPAAFSGPGNAVSGALVHYGAEAYNATYATGLGKAFNVCLAADVSCADLSFGADGSVVNSLVGASLCSAVTCTIKTAYNHIANGTDDLTNATEATRPTILFNCQGGRACMVFASGQFLAASNWNGASALNQPFTISAVFMDTGSVTSGGSLVMGADNASGSFIRGIFSNDGAANKIELYAGGAGVINVAAANNSWHSLSGAANGASSDMNVDGSANSGSVDANGLLAARISLSNPTTPIIGKIGRAGVWGSAFSGANSTAMSASDHTFWGF